MKHAALIVAGGRGHRIGGEIPKQYQMLGGIPVLRHSLLTLLEHPRLTTVAVVIHPEDRALYDSATGALPNAEKLIPCCFGGPTRQDSVRMGLEALAAWVPHTVLIHDAARPFLRSDDIDRLLQGLSQSPGAILAVPVTDTLKQEVGSGRIGDGPERTGIWRAQTPQAFHFEAILAAHREAQGEALTDDAAVAARAGLAVQTVRGSEDNLKVTEPADFARAEKIMLQRLGDIRVGQGFDVHAFSSETGRPLILCGIAVPHSRGLAGHSDADVGLHALTDAILGAIAAADIGAHFSPADPRWKDAASAGFLAHAASLVAERGGAIAHLDVTIVCEAPKIGPHRLAMRQRIAEICGLTLDRVAVKATTTEQLGFTGRGEGIAAQATATVRLPL